MSEQIINGIVTTLATAITSSGQTTGIQVTAIPGAVTGTLRLIFAGSGAEIITFTGTTGSGPYTLTGVTRGAEGTTAATHSNGTAVGIGVVTAGMLNAGFLTASPILIRHADGTITPYTTVALALAASVSGDTICIYESVSVTANLAKNGVNWYFLPGVTITLSSSSAGYMFDDLGVACSYSVGGAGNFVRLCNNPNNTLIGSTGAGFGGSSLTNGGDTGVFNQSNSSSSTIFNYGSIASNYTGTSTGSTAYESAVALVAGNVTFSGGEISTNSGGAAIPTVAIWWINANANLTSTNVISDQEGIYLASTNSASGTINFYLNAQEILGGGDGITLINASTDASAAAWISCSTLWGDNQQFGQNDGGKLYLAAQKAFGAFVASSGSSASQTYLAFQKIGGGTDSTDYITVSGTSAYVNATIGKFDPTTTGRLVAASAGTTILSGGDLTPNTSSDCIFSTGSGTVVTVLSGNIITGSSQHDLATASSGIINVAAGVGYSAAKTSGTGIKPIGVPRIVTSSTPSTGNTVSATTSMRDETLYITPAGTLVALTVSLPAVANARVGQIIRAFISQIITTLTVSVSGSGTAVGSTPVTSATNSFFAYECVSIAGNGTWARIT